MVIFFMTPVGGFFWLGSKAAALLYSELLALILGTGPVFEIVI